VTLDSLKLSFRHHELLPLVDDIKSNEKKRTTRTYILNVK